MQNGDRSLPDVKPRISDELEKSRIWKLTEIDEPSQLRSLRLPDSLLSVRVWIFLKASLAQSHHVTIFLIYVLIHNSKSLFIYSSSFHLRLVNLDDLGIYIVFSSHLSGGEKIYHVLLGVVSLCNFEIRGNYYLN